MQISLRLRDSRGAQRCGQGLAHCITLHSLDDARPRRAIAHLISIAGIARERESIFPESQSHHRISHVHVSLFSYSNRARYPRAETLGRAARFLRHAVLNRLSAVAEVAMPLVLVERIGAGTGAMNASDHSAAHVDKAPVPLYAVFPCRLMVGPPSSFCRQKSRSPRDARSTATQPHRWSR